MKPHKGTLRRFFLSENNKHAKLLRGLWLDFFKLPLDGLRNDFTEAYSTLKEWFGAAEWYLVYDFVEFVPGAFPDSACNDRFRQYCNTILEREKAGYRFVGDRLAQITSDIEIAAIEEAQRSPIDSVAQHMRCSVALFADRNEPDYRNAMKEAISAIEALVRRHSGGDKGDLGRLLTRLEKEGVLHPALKAALGKLYGYSSDESGIRHALIDQPTVTFDDAKFMLVICSAFVNYAQAKLSAVKTDD